MIETIYVVGMIITTLLLYYTLLKEEDDVDIFICFLYFLLSFMLSFAWPVMLVLYILFFFVHRITLLLMGKI